MDRFYFIRTNTQQDPGGGPPTHDDRKETAEGMVIAVHSFLMSFVSWEPIQDKLKNMTNMKIYLKSQRLKVRHTAGQTMTAWLLFIKGCKPKMLKSKKT